MGSEMCIRDSTGNENDAFRGGADWHLVVAPHEFFHYGAGLGLLEKKLPRNLIFFDGDQPGAHWLSLNRRLFPPAREIWHLDPRAVRAIRGQGFACRHVPLGFSARCALFRPVRRLPAMDRTAALSPSDRGPSPRALAGRPFDLFFSGSLTARRKSFFLRHARALARFRNFLHFTDPRVPVRPEHPGALDSRASAGLEQRAKVVLNLHRGGTTFLEWHRIALHGLAQRALVVSEPVGPSALLKPGRDFIAAPLNEIPATLERLLFSPEGRRKAQRIADQGHETFSRNCRMSDFLKPAVAGLS